MGKSLKVLVPGSTKAKATLPQGIVRQLAENAAGHKLSTKQYGEIVKLAAAATRAAVGIRQR